MISEGLQTQALPVLGAAALVKRHNSNSNLASYKRGRGGRSSFSGNVVTVFGAGGFLGKYVVNQLGKHGSQVICPYRGEPYFMKELKLAGDLGQILFLPFHLQDEESIRKVMKYSNVVVNLVGREWETKNFKFHDVHVEGARTIARLARECGVEKLIHFSALNASPNPKPIFVKGGSQFLRSKYEGELAVREEFPDATIMRPADIYGANDRFMCYYANKWRYSGPRCLPLWKGGKETIKMPIHCSDVAEGVLKAISNPDAVGRTYECVGPSSYTLLELVDYFMRCMREPGVKPGAGIWTKMRYRSFSPLYKMRIHFFISNFPSRPPVTLEKLDKEHTSDLYDGKNPTLEDLGVKLARIEDRADYELKPFRRNKYYEERVGEFSDPSPPKALA